MINNFLEQDYQSSHNVYTHNLTKHRIHLGDVSSAVDIAFIKAEGIRTVVTAAVGMEQVSYDSSIHHVVYPLLDMKSENISKFFNEFYDLMEKQLSRGHVLVHCAAGISRSATLVISYLMKKNSWSFKEAIQFVRQSRPGVCPNLGFERQLKEYEQHLNKKSQSEDNNRRFGSKTSQERKHNIYSSSKVDALPEIGILGKTQLRSKILDPFSVQSARQASQQHYRLKQMRSVNQQSEPYGTKRFLLRTKRSGSEVEKTMTNPSLVGNRQFTGKRQLNLQRLKMSAPIERLDPVIVKKLNLTEKYTSNQRHPRSTALYRMGIF